MANQQGAPDQQQGNYAAQRLHSLGWQGRHTSPFTRDDLLKKFNLIGSQRKGWLLPNYGRASYADMTNEEQAVVEAFEGGEAYQETCERQEFYLGRPELVLGAGGDGTCAVSLFRCLVMRIALLIRAQAYPAFHALQRSSSLANTG